MNPLVLLAPLFLVFEVWQLVLCERYLGIRQIKANIDPRSLPMRESLAAVWSLILMFYLGWMGILLLHPVGRAQGLVLLAVTALGYGVRSSCGLKWVLVVLTFEGSIRVGMLLSLCGLAARRLLL
jgi:hypothetical protein